MKKVAFYTLGCKVNQYETEAMLELFEKDGYEQVNSEEYADVYVINTCTVTHMSDRKSRQYIRRVKKKNPDAIIAVVGCYSQVSPEEILGIVDEVKKLANNGYKEVVLTGIHVASYGKDLKDRDIKLLDVIKQINQIEKIERIRLSSVEPILFTDEFVNEVLKMDKVCPHYHLSLQSGCDETLKRMNRRYTTLEYKTIVDRLRSKMPDVAITTDVIVGFPGETNEEFKKTYEFLKEIELSQMHIFKYSPRKGTPAATMENQVDPQMKHFRSEQLLNLSKVNFNKFATKFIGRELDVLFEQNIEGNKYEGLTSNYIRVVVESDKNIQGQILKVKINDVKDEYVEGTLV